MNEHLDPRNPRPIHDAERERDPIYQDAWRETNERSYSSMAPFAIIALLLLFGVTYFGSTTSDKQSTTQIGQNVERPQANPSAPRDPNNMTKPQ